MAELQVCRCNVHFIASQIGNVSGCTNSSEFGERFTEGRLHVLLYIKVDMDNTHSKHKTNTHTHVYTHEQGGHVRNNSTIFTIQTTGFFITSLRGFTQCCVLNFLLQLLTRHKHSTYSVLCDIHTNTYYTQSFTTYKTYPGSRRTTIRHQDIHANIHYSHTNVIDYMKMTYTGSRQTLHVYVYTCLVTRERHACEYRVESALQCSGAAWWSTGTVSTVLT